MGVSASTRRFMAALRLGPSVRFDSSGDARQTIHQQLLGPPRTSNSRSKSGQLCWSTSRKVKAREADGWVIGLTPKVNGTVLKIANVVEQT
jgi:hypothetical protein